MCSTALAFASVVSLVVLAPPASAQWSQTWVEAFGGSGTDWVLDAAPAPLGGIFATGSTRSFGQGADDGWVFRVASNGAPQWELALGGGGGDELQSVANTPDGGCILAGSTTSFGAGGSDGWVVKLDGNGTVQWQRTYGTQGDESFASIAAIKTDSITTNYYVGGSAEFGATQRDVWLLRLDASGSVIWERNYAGEKNDDLASLAATKTGLVFVANSNSNFTGSQAVAVPGIPFFRPWIVTLHPDGKIDQQRTFNLSGGDALNDVQPAGDGFILTGEILAHAFFRGDVWVLRLDEMLNIVWDRRYGDHFGVTFYDAGQRVRPIWGGGFLVAGSTETAGAGSQDAYLLQLDSAGNRVADRTVGDTGYDGGNALVVQGRTAVVGGFLQQVTPQPVDGLLARVPLPGSVVADALCPPIFPTAPNEWTSALTIGAPTVESTPTAASSAASRAVVTNLRTGLFVCP